MSINTSQYMHLHKAPILGQKSGEESSLCELTMSSFLLRSLFLWGFKVQCVACPCVSVDKLEVILARFPQTDISLCAKDKDMCHLQPFGRCPDVDKETWKVLISGQVKSRGEVGLIRYQAAQATGRLVGKSGTMLQCQSSYLLKFSLLSNLDLVLVAT